MITIDVEVCPLTCGAPPCQARGEDYCYNTRETCISPGDYVGAAQEVDRANN